MTILNYASNIVNKLEALLTDDARVVIYDCLVSIVQATERSYTQVLGKVVSKARRGQTL
jgi:hypothetical protein